jgi:hypothetical protein
MMKLLSLLLIVYLGVACSSKKTVKEVDYSSTISRDYLVRESTTSGVRPGWIEDAEVWADQEKMDTKRYRFFSFETEPQSSQAMACNIAQANARAAVAGEITTFIEKSFASSTEGASAIDPNNPKTQPLRDYVSNTLAEKVKSLVHGAEVIKKYWEKRHYQQKMGAKKDYFAFTCAVLIRMESSRLKAAIEKASEDLVEKADPEVKDNVKKALEKLDEEFVKARHGQV